MNTEKINKIFFGIVIVAIIAAVVSSAGCFGFFEGYGEKAQEMTSADYAIGQYKFFIDKYNAIRQMGTQIENAELDIDDYKDLHPNPEFWTRTENDNHEELRFVRTGYIQQYNKFIADYNARMRDITTNQFWMKPQNYPESLKMYSRASTINEQNSLPLLMPSTVPQAPAGWKIPTIGQ